jgi:tRNA G26 N,N-dimethylase Trm1
MTESQRIVLNWRAKLKAADWPEDAIAEIVKGLCEAGYRACIEEIQARAAQTDALIAKVAKN